MNRTHKSCVCYLENDGNKIRYGIIERKREGFFNKFQLNLVVIGHASQDHWPPYICLTFRRLHVAIQRVLTISTGVLQADPTLLFSSIVIPDIPTKVLKETMAK